MTKFERPFLDLLFDVIFPFFLLFLMIQKNLLFLSTDPKTTEQFKISTHFLSSMLCYLFPFFFFTGKCANQYFSVFDIILQKKGCPSDKEIAQNE